LEGYALNERERARLDEVLEDADSVIVITESDGAVHLSFSQHLTEMETLDILALVTSKFYEIANEDSGNFH
jgi:hypothetical protein